MASGQGVDWNEWEARVLSGLMENMYVDEQPSSTASPSRNLNAANDANPVFSTQAIEHFESDPAALTTSPSLPSLSTSPPLKSLTPSPPLLALTPSPPLSPSTNSQHASTIPASNEPQQRSFFKTANDAVLALDIANQAGCSGWDRDILRASYVADKRKAATDDGKDEPFPGVSIISGPRDWPKQEDEHSSDYRPAYFRTGKDAVRALDIAKHSNFDAPAGGWDDLTASHVVEIRKMANRSGKKQDPFPRVDVVLCRRGWPSREDGGKTEGHRTKQ